MYRPGSNDIYFPQGSVWGTVRRAHFVSFDAHALAYGLDSQAAWPARDALAQHVAGQQALVAANGTGDGRTYSFDPAVANSQESYNGREEYAASQLAAGLAGALRQRQRLGQDVQPAAAEHHALPAAAAADPGADRLVRRHGGSSPDGERLSP